MIPAEHKTEWKRSLIEIPWPWHVAGPIIGLMVPLMIWIGRFPHSGLLEHPIGEGFLPPVLFGFYWQSLVIMFFGALSALADALHGIWL